MYLIINNERKTFTEEALMLGVLLSKLGMENMSVAVAVNGKLVPEVERKTTQLCDGDNILLITAAYGG